MSEGRIKKSTWLKVQPIVMPRQVLPGSLVLIIFFASVWWIAAIVLLYSGFNHGTAKGIMVLLPPLLGFAIVSTLIALDAVTTYRNPPSDSPPTQVAKIMDMMSPSLYPSILLIGFLVGALMAYNESFDDHRTGFAVAACILGALVLLQLFGCAYAWKNAKAATGDSLTIQNQQRVAPAAQLLWTPNKAAALADALSWEVSYIQVIRKWATKQNSSGREIRKTLWSSGLQTTIPQAQVEMIFALPEDLLLTDTELTIQFHWDVWVAPMRNGQPLYEVLREI
jgi:hypothetical protein